MIGSCAAMLSNAQKLGGRKRRFTFLLEEDGGSVNSWWEGDNCSRQLHYAYAGISSKK